VATASGPGGLEGETGLELAFELKDYEGTGSSTGGSGKCVDNFL
jgi:hypothetical protein